MSEKMKELENYFMTGLEKNDWIEWKGWKRPPLIDGLRCDMLLRSGEIMECENYQDWWDDWVYSESDVPKPFHVVGFKAPTWGDMSEDDFSYVLHYEP